MQAADIKGCGDGCSWYVETDNASHGREFEMDPFAVEKQSPAQYCWYGKAPTLFDAPLRGKRVELDWVGTVFWPPPLCKVNAISDHA